MIVLWNLGENGTSQVKEIKMNKIVYNGITCHVTMVVMLMMINCGDWWKVLDLNHEIGNVEFWG